MLQHHQEPEPASNRSLPTKADFTSAEIETYLDRISPPAEGALTESERQERRAEMKTHLESLIAAYMELGDTQEQAVARALQQFGASRSVQREWKRVTADDLRQSRRVAGTLYGTTFALFVLAMSKPEFINGMHMNLLYFLGLLSVPAGFGMGFLARSHPIRSAFKLQALFALPVFCMNVHWLLWPRAVEAVQDKGIAPSAGSILREILSPQHFCLQVLGILALIAAGGILAGSLSAGFGGWLRKHNLRMRQDLAR